MLKGISHRIRGSLLYRLINLLGLTLGFTCAFIILLFVSRELSFNSDHLNRGQVYRILAHFEDVNWTRPLAPYPLGPALKSDYPEIAAFTRMDEIRLTIENKGDAIPVNSVFGADPGITDIFTFHFSEGDGSKLFAGPDEIVLSKSLAKRLFGDQKGLGRVLECQIERESASLTVTGIYDDLPETSTFRPAAMIPVKRTITKMTTFVRDPGFETNFDNIYYQTYFRLKTGINAGAFREKLKQAGKKYMRPELKVSLGMQSLKDIYLRSGHLTSNPTIEGNLKQIRVFILIGILILVIATFNYVILSAARSTLRYREIGMRKVVGATHGSLSAGIFGESLLVSFLALPLAFLVMLLLLPVVNRLFNTHLVFSFHDQWLPLCGFILICVITGILSGTYLAFYLARLSPVDVLRNKASVTGRKSIFYKMLVIMQIMIVMSLLSASGLIYHQIAFVEKMDMGLDRHNLVIVNTNYERLPNPRTFIDEIRQSPLILNASSAFGCPPAYGRGVAPVARFDDPSVKVSVEGLNVGMDFIETFRFRLIAGRSFSREFPGDRERNVIINETAVRELGIRGDPIGEKMFGGTIIGVIGDFNLHSAREKIPPVFLMLSDIFIFQLPVRLAEGRTKEGLEFLKSTWSRNTGGSRLEYEFFDDALAGMYKDDRNFGLNIRIFTTLAIVIALLGLFGLSLFSASQRTREIGIRKINGAGIADIILLLNKGFFMMVLAAFVISVPVTTLIMDNWLAGFAYRAPFDILVYLKAGLISLMVVLATVTIHSWRAARSNPADAVKT